MEKNSTVLFKNIAELLITKSIFTEWKEITCIVTTLGIILNQRGNDSIILKENIEKISIVNNKKRRDNVSEIVTSKGVVILAFQTSEVHTSFTSSLSELASGINIRKDYIILESDLIYDEDSRISSGAAGSVFKATYHGQPVAVKLLHPLVDNRDAIREISILCEVSHSYCLSFIGYFIYEKWNSFGIVTEFISGGNLRSIIEVEKVSFKMKLMYLRDICIGMEYLHRSKIAHRDLKPANILITTKSDSFIGPTIKIADFGESKDFAKASPTNTINRGTPLYMAPEVSVNKYYDPMKSDVYSFGKVLYELIMNVAPDERNFEINRKEMKRLVIEDVPFASQLNHIFQLTCYEEPEHRPSFIEIVNLIKDIISKIPAAILPSVRNRDNQPRGITIGVRISAEKLEKPNFNIENNNNNNNNNDNNDNNNKNIVNIIEMNKPERKSSITLYSDLQFSPRKEEKSLLCSILQGNGQMTWEKFVGKIMDIFETCEISLNSLRPIFFFDVKGDISSELVTIERVNNFIKWFGEIQREAGDPHYTGIDDIEDQDLLTFVEIGSFVCQPYYHGFIDREESERRVKEGDTGTFLIRLRASEVGSFVLTLNTGNNSARHCIIQRALTAFEIFGEQFRDIVTLVNTFKIKPIVGLHPKTKAILFECLLTTPASNQSQG